MSLPAAAIWLAFLLCLTLVGAAGPVLSRNGDVIAVKTNLSGGWAGFILVASITYLPELVVSIIAARIGAVDMAMASIPGSNIFNMLILGVDDLFYRPGPILYHVSPIHVVSALSCMVTSGLLIAGLLYRPQTRLFRTVGWISFGLFTTYLLNTYMLYLHGTH
jgi:cation:H+ antiporter